MVSRYTIVRSAHQFSSFNQIVGSIRNVLGVAHSLCTSLYSDPEAPFLAGAASGQERTRSGRLTQLNEVAAKTKEHRRPTRSRCEL